MNGAPILGQRQLVVEMFPPAPNIFEQRAPPAPNEGEELLPLQNNWNVAHAEPPQDDEESESSEDMDGWDNAMVADFAGQDIVAEDLGGYGDFYQIRPVTYDMSGNHSLVANSVRHYHGKNRTIKLMEDENLDKYTDMKIPYSGPCYKQNTDVHNQRIQPFEYASDSLSNQFHSVFGRQLKTKLRPDDRVLQEFDAYCAIECPRIANQIKNHAKDKYFPGFDEFFKNA